MLLQLHNVKKMMYGAVLFEGLNVIVYKGDKIGVVGRNGSGKSTLLHMMMKSESVDYGTVSHKQGIRVGLLKQSRNSSMHTVAEELETSRKELVQLKQQLTSLENKLAQATIEEMDGLLATYGKVSEAFVQQGGYAHENNSQSICKGLGIEKLYDSPMHHLSGGEQTIVSLAKLLLMQPDVYLLDEPTNHLDEAAMNWLEKYIKASTSTFVMVSHDRYFLNETVEKIIEIDLEVATYTGNYDVYKKEKEERNVKIAKDYGERQKEIKKIKDAIRRFRQWGNESDNEKFYKKAKQLEHRLERMEDIQTPKNAYTPIKTKKINVERSGKEVIRMENVKKSSILSDVSEHVWWQDRIALKGANGSGKTTLLKIITGELETDAGTVTIGNSVSMGYLAQQINYSNKQQTILIEFQETAEVYEEQARRTLAQYGFYQEDVHKKVGQLSGGEKVRLELAKLLEKETNLLLLDEPTNHLDLETRERLEEILLSYQGTLLLVSHDRYFVEKMTDKIWYIKNGRVNEEM